mgnify:CR=1 FL=1
MQEQHGRNMSQALGFPTVLTNPVDLGFPLGRTSAVSG